MNLDQWLKEVYDEEVLIKEGQDLEATFDQMSPEDLLEIACGRATVKVAAPQPPQPDPEPVKVASAPAPRKKGLTKESAIKLKFMDKVARQLARTRHEVVKEAQGQPDWYTRQLQAQQAAQESPGLQAAVGGGLGGLVGHSIGAARGRGLAGGLIGGGLGVGAGLLGAHLAKRRRAAIQQMGPVPGMVKQDEFTSPEAKAKAQVMQKSMKMAKGAAPPVRKKAVKAAGDALSPSGQ